MDNLIESKERYEWGGDKEKRGSKRGAVKQVEVLRSDIHET